LTLRVYAYYIFPGLTDPVDPDYLPDDKMPFTTLIYANGPGYQNVGRPNMTAEDVGKELSTVDSTLPEGAEYCYYETWRPEPYTLCVIGFCLSMFDLQTSFFSMSYYNFRMDTWIYECWYEFELRLLA
jgi:hypothetical protein